MLSFKKAVAVIVLAAVVILTWVIGTSSAKTVSIHVNIPQTSVITIPKDVEVIDENQSLGIYIRSNVSWSLILLKNNKDTDVIESIAHEARVNGSFEQRNSYVYTLL